MQVAWHEAFVQSGGGGFVMLIAAFPAFVGSWLDVAFTVADPAVPGAVYRPLAFTVPLLVDQNTPEL